MDTIERTRWPETRRAWARLKAAFKDYRAAKAEGRHTSAEFVDYIAEINRLNEALRWAKWKFQNVTQAHSIDGADGPPTWQEIAEEAMQQGQRGLDDVVAAIQAGRYINRSALSNPLPRGLKRDRRR